MDVVDLVRALNDASDFPGYQSRSRLGGSASVGAMDTLGYLGGCWCGQPHGHDWEGKAEGAAHPSLT